MDDGPQKLKKPSGGRGKPSNPFHVYLDENLCNCKPIREVLSAAGVEVHSHLDFFQRGAMDEEWLPFVGNHRWTVVTTDRRFRYNELERIAFQNHNVQAFEFTDNRIGAAGMANALALALPAMRKIASKRKKYFVATISKTGQVKVKWDSRLRKKKPI